MEVKYFMKRIFLCGDLKDHSVKNTLTRVQDNYGRFSIYEIEKLSSLKKDCDILVFKNKFKYEKYFLDGKLSCIVDSQNWNAISVLNENLLSPVTCGMTFKDTFNILSLSSRRAVVSLQRRIVSCKGKVIEPCNVKINLYRKTGVYPILVSIAILMLLDVELENEYIF